MAKKEKNVSKKDKTPEITKASKALQNYLKENNLDPSKDWSKDKKHGKTVKELMAKLAKERDKVAAKYPENGTEEKNRKKLVKINPELIGEKKPKKEKESKEKATKAPTKYDYPLVDGREMTSAEKKKYRMEQRKLAQGSGSPKKEKKEETKVKKPEKVDKKKEKVVSPKSKDKKKSKAKEED